MLCLLLFVCLPRLSDGKRIPLWDHQSTDEALAPGSLTDTGTSADIISWKHSWWWRLNTDVLLNPPLLSAIHHFVLRRQTFNKDNWVGTYGYEHTHSFIGFQSRNRSLKTPNGQDRRRVFHIMGLRNLVHGATKTHVCVGREVWWGVSFSGVTGNNSINYIYFLQKTAVHIQRSTVIMLPDLVKRKRLK